MESRSSKRFFNYIFFLISDASSRNNDNSGSFSSIFSAIGNKGYAAVNALMGGGAATPTNEERAGRSSKSRRRMNGFDVRKVPVMGVGRRGHTKLVDTHTHP